MIPHASPAWLMAAPEMHMRHPLPAGFVALQHGFAGFERGGCVSAHCEAPHVGRLEGISLRLADAGAAWSIARCVCQ